MDKAERDRIVDSLLSVAEEIVNIVSLLVKDAEDVQAVKKNTINARGEITTVEYHRFDFIRDKVLEIINANPAITFNNLMNKVKETIEKEPLKGDFEFYPSSKQVRWRVLANSAINDLLKKGTIVKIPGPEPMYLSTYIYANARVKAPAENKKKSQTIIQPKISESVVQASNTVENLDNQQRLKNLFEKIKELR